MENAWKEYSDAFDVFIEACDNYKPYARPDLWENTLRHMEEEALNAKKFMILLGAITPETRDEFIALLEMAKSDLKTKTDAINQALAHAKTRKATENELERMRLKHNQRFM